MEFLCTLRSTMQYICLATLELPSFKVLEYIDIFQQGGSDRVTSDDFT